MKETKVPLKVLTDQAEINEKAEAYNSFTVSEKEQFLKRYDGNTKDRIIAAAIKYGKMEERRKIAIGIFGQDEQSVKEQDIFRFKAANAYRNLGLTAQDSFLSDYLKNNGIAETKKLLILNEPAYERYVKEYAATYLGLSTAKKKSDYLDGFYAAVRQVILQEVSEIKNGKQANQNETQTPIFSNKPNEMSKKNNTPAPVKTAAQEAATKPNEITFVATAEERALAIAGAKSGAENDQPITPQGRVIKFLKALYKVANSNSFGYFKDLTASQLEKQKNGELDAAGIVKVHARKFSTIMRKFTDPKDKGGYQLETHEAHKAAGLIIDAYKKVYDGGKGAKAAAEGAEGTLESIAKVYAKASEASGKTTRVKFDIEKPDATLFDF